MMQDTKKTALPGRGCVIVLIRLEDYGLSTLYPTLKYSIIQIIAYKKLLVNIQVNFRMSHWYYYRSGVFLLSMAGL